MSRNRTVDSSKKPKDYVKMVKIASLLFSIAMIVVGLLIACNPSAAMLTICMIVGFVLTAGGAVLLIAYLVKRKEVDRHGLDTVFLIFGIIMLAFGIVIVIRPGIIAGFVHLLLSIVLLVHGVFSIIEGTGLKNKKDNKWVIPLITGIITLVLGIVVLVNPFAADAILMLVLGIAMVFAGVNGLCVSLRTIQYDRKRRNVARDGEAIDVEAREID